MSPSTSWGLAIKDTIRRHGKHWLFLGDEHENRCMSERARIEGLLLSCGEFEWMPALLRQLDRGADWIIGGVAARRISSSAGRRRKKPYTV